jgi:hypothetical protein
LPRDSKAAPVWARKTVAIESCPKSYITAESEGLVEDFLVRRRLGGMSFAELSARQVEGFLILEQALAAENVAGGEVNAPQRRGER